MRKLWRFCAILANLAVLSSCGGTSNGTPSGPNPPPPVQSGAYVITAWSELGMHCIDGKDYSIFGVLPPYNTIHAQVVKRADPPVVVTTGVTLTYEAMTDTTGSSNTSSSSKTNFWSYVQALFLTTVAPDTGLTGNKVQSIVPQAMSYNSALGVWEAVGIPTVPYDDAGNPKPYPLSKITA